MRAQHIPPEQPARLHSPPMERKRSWPARVAIVVGGALALLTVPLANRYPLLDADTGTYLLSAFTGLVPLDRPYWYGLFVRLASLDGVSLWGVVALQAVLCSAMLWRCWRVFGDGRARTYLLTIAVLAPITGLGWYTGQLMSDTFTLTGILAGLLVLLAPAHPAERAGWALLVFFSCWVHSSHMLIFPITFAVFGLYLAWRKQAVARGRAVLLGATVLLAWPGLYTANGWVSGEPFLSRYSHVFLMSGMADNGILAPWLADHCPDARYGICQYADSVPTTHKAFMWEARSPLQWQGGPLAVRAEWDAIIRSTLTEPKYIALHVRASAINTVRVLGIWRIADGIQGDYFRQPYSPPYGGLRDHLPHELDTFLASAQNTGEGTMGLPWLDHLYQLVLVLSLAGGVWVWRHPHRPAQARTVLVLCLLTVVIGAWICGTLSTVDSRFMARTAWSLPFVVALFAWRMKHTVQATDRQ